MVEDMTSPEKRPTLLRMVKLRPWQLHLYKAMRAQYGKKTMFIVYAHGLAGKKFFSTWCNLSMKDVHHDPYESRYASNKWLREMHPMRRVTFMYSNWIWNTQSHIALQAVTRTNYNNIVVMCNTLPKTVPKTSRLQVYVVIDNKFVVYDNLEDARKNIVYKASFSLNNEDDSGGEYPQIMCSEK